MKKRTKSREYAVQMMYQAEIMTDPHDVSSYAVNDIKDIFWKSFDPVASDIREFSEELFCCSFENRAEHDRMISQFLKESWSLERLGEMEKCILRVALEELLNSSTPAYAVLDDYVTLTKKFTDEKTASFVNGLLEKVRNNFTCES